MSKKENSIRKIIALALATVLVFIKAEEDTEKKDSVRLVQVVFRHGARTPEILDLYPNEVYNSTFFVPPGYGQLTNKGKRMCFELGKSLRYRYKDFLGDVYMPGLVSTTTTDSVRTKMSALLVHAGLFPPEHQKNKWHESLNWQPLPYDFDKYEKDYRWTRPVVYCPEYKKELESVLQEEKNLKYLEAHKKFFHYLEEKTGKKIDTLEKAFYAYQVWSAEKTMGLKLPTWLRPEERSLIVQMTVKQCHAENFNSKLKRLGGGRMLQALLENMKQKSEETLKPPERKMFLYSGHDYSVYNLLASMDLYDNAHFPKYTAAVLLELHYFAEETENWAVKILYQPSSLEEAKELILPGCTKFCPLKKFVSLVKDHIPGNYTKECDSKINLD